MIAMGAFVLLLAGPSPALSASTGGDFNGDGRSDLAVGVVFEDVSGVVNAGAVNVLVGGPSGLRTRGGRFLHRGLAGMAGGGPETNANFGTGLASGDFNGDGHDDLAVGVPGEGGGSFVGPGAVNVIYGSGKGLTLKGDRRFSQDTPGMAGDGSDGGDLFGYALAAGDFDGDGRDDLAISAPSETAGGPPAAEQGAVTVLYGSRKGLRTKGSRFFGSNSPGLQGRWGEDGDRFGLSLAAGDFDRDGRDDLAVGAPSADIAAMDDGAVGVLYGSHHGLRAKRSNLLSQSSAGIIGDGGEDGDQFGAALAAGDFDADGRDDLAIGVQFEDVASTSSAGAVTVVSGSPHGLSPDRSSLFTQSTAGMAGDGAEVNDAFGARLAAGRFNAGPRIDLAIGARGEDVPPLPSTGEGAVNVLYGSDNGLRTNGSQFLHQGNLGIPGENPEQGDEFGDALGAGDFDGKGPDDLVVGVPLEDLPAVDANPNDGVIDLIPGGVGSLNPGSTREISQATPGVANAPEPNDFFGASLAPPDGAVLTNVFD